MSGDTIKLRDEERAATLYGNLQRRPSLALFTVAEPLVPLVQRMAARDGRVIRVSPGAIGDPKVIELFSSEPQAAAV